MQGDASCFGRDHAIHGQCDPSQTSKKALQGIRGGLEWVKSPARSPDVSIMDRALFPCLTELVNEWAAESLPKRRMPVKRAQSEAVVVGLLNTPKVIQLVGRAMDSQSKTWQTRVTDSQGEVVA